MTDRYIFEDEADFKAWRLAKPALAKLLQKIIFTWRGNSMRVSGKPGKWAVHPHAEWQKLCELSPDQLKRGLKKLAAHGLILRERHQFGGPLVRAYLQPTRLALKYMGRPDDIKRLAPTDAPTSAPMDALTDAPTGAPTFTSIPSLQKDSSLLNLDGNGKEVSGKVENGDAAFGALKKLKAEKSEKLFPEVKGQHEKFVKHPIVKFPHWESFSIELKQEIYAKYQAYVSNWYKGKSGKAHVVASDWTDEDEAEFLEAMKKNAASI